MQQVTIPTLGMVAGSCGQKYRHEPMLGTEGWVAHGNNFSFWMRPPMMPAWHLPRGSGACITLQHLHPTSSPSIPPEDSKPPTTLSSWC